MFLILPFSPAAEIKDNAQWIQESIGKEIRLPHSLLKEKSVVVREGRSSSFSELITAAIVSKLADSGATIVSKNAPTGIDSAHLVQFNVVSLGVNFTPIYRKSLLGPKLTKRISKIDIDISVYNTDAKLFWTGKSLIRHQQEIDLKDIGKTRSEIYKELNASLPGNIKPNFVDGIILLGTAMGLIYFLYY